MKLKQWTPQPTKKLFSDIFINTKEKLSLLYYQQFKFISNTFKKQWKTKH